MRIIRELTLPSRIVISIFIVGILANLYVSHCQSDYAAELKAYTNLVLRFSVTKGELEERLQVFRNDLNSKDNKEIFKMSEAINFKINGTNLTFNVSSDDYENFVNEMQPNNKVTPMHNFLVRTVDPESKEALMPFLENGASTMEIGGKVVELYTPKLKITVGE